MAPRGKPRKSATPLAGELRAERPRNACPQAQCCLPTPGGFDGLLLRAVRDYAREQGSKVRSFNTTLLKFPVMKQGFKAGASGLLSACDGALLIHASTTDLWVSCS